MTGPRNDTANNPGNNTANTTASDPVAKDPDEWTTGEEAMTAPQQSYLGTLAQEAGEDVPESLTKAEASKLIEELQRRTGRGGNPDGDA